MPHDNINNRTATPLELALKRKESANALLGVALTKAAALDPPYSESITIRREIQACKDLVRVEDQSYADELAGVILPQPVPGTPAGTYSKGIVATGF